MFDAIREREFGLGDIIKTSCKVYIKQIKLIVLMSLIVIIPINALSYYCLDYVGANPSISPESAFIVGLSLICLGIFMIVVGIAWKNAIILLVEKSVGGEQAELGGKNIFKMAFSRVGSVVFAIFLGMFICFGLTFLLIIPAIVWMMYYVFVQQAAVLRGVSSEKALVYSKYLVKGRWWRTFGKMFVIGLMYFVVCLCLVLAEKYFSTSVNILLNSLIAIVEAFVHIFITVMFLNLDYITNKKPESEAALS
jgi:hypothetical protein